MRIIELKAENFKRLLAVEIKPGEGLVQITGRNGQGKSSILDAVFAAFGGGEAIPGKPLRKGAAKAEIFVDVGDIRVTRRFTEKGTTLYVENKEGLRYTSPQAILDELVGKLTFDPMQFLRMRHCDQAATLREVAGLDTDELDRRRVDLYGSRTVTNKRAKSAAAVAEAMPKYEAPAEPVSTVVLARQHKAARDVNAATQAANNHLKLMQEARDQQVKAVEELDAKLRIAKVGLEQREARLEQAKSAAADRTPIDLSAIEAEMEAAEETNAKVAANAKRAEAIAEAKKLLDEAAQMTKEIEKVEAAKAKILAETKMPIDGLGVEGGDTVTFKGIPLDQASSAEQIRVALAISAALNPRLRVVMIRDGSLLDDESLAEVAAWAEANEMQVLCERVANGDEAVGIVIEDGQVVEPARVLAEVQ